MNTWFITASGFFLPALAVYLLLINFFGFAQMGIDKRRAIHRQWRIPEARLFAVAAIGGALGSLLGMFIFRHKTKHTAFVVGMPLILIAQLILAGWLCYFLKS